MEEKINPEQEQPKVQEEKNTNPFSKLVESVVGVVDNAKKQVEEEEKNKSFFDKLVDRLEDAGDVLKETASKIGDGLSEQYENIKKNDTVKNILDKGEDVFESIKDKGSDIIESVKDKAGDLKERYIDGKEETKKTDDTPKA
jgi:hypothetical protein